MGRGARRAERRRDRAGAFRGAGPDHRAAAEVGMAASRRAQQRGHLCSARPARGRQLVRLPHRRAVPSPGRCAPARHLFRAPIANCLAPHRSVSQKCLTLIGDLVAEPDADIDGLVRSQLLQSLVTKMADSKMIVRKAASQVHIGCPTASGSHRLTPPSQRPPPKNPWLWHAARGALIRGGARPAISRGRATAVATIRTQLSASASRAALAPPPREPPRPRAFRLPRPPRPLLSARACAHASVPSPVHDAERSRGAGDEQAVAGGASVRALFAGARLLHDKHARYRSGRRLPC